MYKLSDHAAMLVDGTRIGAYLRALEQHVTPGCIVADIGTGVGIFALLAARLGAGLVYAIEPGESIHVAERIARDNGLHKRIRFINDVSTAVSPKCRADIVVSDLRGVLPLFENHLHAIIDARQRLLAPGGKLIPLQDQIYVAPVEAEAHYSAITGPWEKSPLQLDLGVGRKLATNAWHRHGPGEVTALAPGELWTTLDYRRVEDLNAEGECQWRIRRAGVLHGFSVWFESQLADHVRLSNAPSNPGLVYGAAFFPLTDALAVSEGDRLKMKLGAVHMAGDYVWRWETDLQREREQKSTARFKQSTFYAAPLSLRSLNKGATHNCPGLKPQGRAALDVLEAMEKGRSMEQIVKALEQDNADLFSRHGSAQQFASQIFSSYRA
jgi:protein arginine N-methyltransferase 1